MHSVVFVRNAQFLGTVHPLPIYVHIKPNLHLPNNYISAHLQHKCKFRYILFTKRICGIVVFCRADTTPGMTVQDFQAKISVICFRDSSFFPFRFPAARIRGVDLPALVDVLHG